MFNKPIFTNKLITTPLQKLINAIKGTNQNHIKSYNEMQQRLHEEQMKVSEEIEKNKAYERLFEESTDALAVLEDGIIVQCNKAAMRMMRVKDKSKIIGFKPGELSLGYQPDGERSEKKAEKLIELASKNGTQHFEWVHNGIDRKKYWFDITLTPVSLKNHNVVYATLRNITLIKKNETAIVAHKNRLYRLANKDKLTGLPNRRYFSEHLEEALERAKRHETMLAVLFIDLDRFKPINDSLGHAVGDKVLQEVAARLQDATGKEDLLARLGGDEFIVSMENLQHENAPSIVSQKILQALTEPIYVDEHTLYISCSIGISLYPRDDGSVHNLIKYADAAMYKAKAEGRNNYQYYSSDLTEIALLRVSMEAKLRESLKNKDFIVYYQPQVNAKENRVIGMEALVRWNPETDELISPDKFISLAEETGLIVEIDNFVIKTALIQMRKWYDAGLKPGVLSLNISMNHLECKNCVHSLKKILSKTKCKAEWISFEITENLIMSHPERAMKTLDELHDMGIKISIDDFGTGYSSLSYLKRLPIDKLKIDRSFVTPLPEDEDSRGIVKAIIDLSKSLHIDVIAEGVENDAQKKFLIEHGCHNIQGYLYGKPMTSQMMEKMLRDDKASGETNRVAMTFF